LDYKGIKCPVCEKLMLEDDDIVVCPECGAPYHRACYMEKGSCIFTELHEKGENWVPPAPPTAPNTVSEIKDQECPNCGVLNAHSAMFCNICGTSLTGEPTPHRNSPYNHHTPHSAAEEERRDAAQTGSYPPPPGVTFHGFGAMPFQFDSMGGVNPEEKLADNVSYGDVSKLVQQNTSYYMPVFHMQQKFKHRKFNFTAFLFSGGWLLYRKQYKSGIIVTGLMALLYMAMYALTAFCAWPVIVQALEAANVHVNDVSLTYLQIGTHLSQYLETHPEQIAALYSPFFCMALMFLVMVVIGFIGNRLYMNHCIRTVQKIKAEAQTESDLEAAYLSCGGVNIAVAFVLMLCYMISQWLPMLL